MPTIAFFNQAGGVGKTTVVHNLGYELVHLGYRVLMVDLDPQASLTQFCGLDPESLSRTMADALIFDEPLPLAHLGDDWGLAPGDIRLSAVERLDFDNNERLQFTLRTVLSAQDWQFILLDCPPSLGNLAHLALAAADLVGVPVETQFKAFLGTDLLLKTVGKVKKRDNPSLKVWAFIPTRFDKRNSQDVRTLKALRANFGVLAPVLLPMPRATVFADAAENRNPVRLYDPQHQVLECIEEYAKNLVKLYGTTKIE